MAKGFQDDTREEEMIKEFLLVKDDEEGRAGIDAFLQLGTEILPFELKTTSDSKGSVTTVRDFGRDHIQKWQGKHWLIGFYSANKVKYYKYGSPKMMEPWISKMEQYVSPDFKLASIASSHIELADLFQILGEKDIYTYQDANSIHKRQYTKNKYIQLMDIFTESRKTPKPIGYSKERMLSILQDRTMYLVERGSTLNNPHIAGSYFDGWEEIKSDFANRLRELVIEALEEN